MGSLNKKVWNTEKVQTSAGYRSDIDFDHDRVNSWESI
ncbi:hypothetical protein B808_925 [Fructilactobacillus florum 8D]|uniref:Uncharacterized protein n=1 Tax=Fructilactobacillus florum 8D TaxID=1221538 RepID=W9EDE9_9LACO|nr:hypothetical protein B807_533 [Fructilactobacillus florum 2F]ETO40158.1 hypothetical protein B808_925 [Fructilactobacillus florum 8D]